MTKKQRDLLIFIGNYYTKHQVAPSYDEMRAAFGLHSRAGVHGKVQTLIKRGYIARFLGAKDYSARAIQITQEGWQVINEHSRTGGFCLACGRVL